MKVTLVGFKSLNFTDAEGNKVEGIRLYIAYPDDDVIGCAVDTAFIRQNVFDRSYYVGGSFYLPYQAQGRTVMATVSFKL